MKEFKIIFNEGIKSCCSSYSAKELQAMTKPWFDKIDNLSVKFEDITDGAIVKDEVAKLAIAYFGDQIYPLTYVDNCLVLSGTFPERDLCYQLINHPDPITKEDIMKEAQRKNQTDQIIN